MKEFALKTVRFDADNESNSLFSYKDALVDILRVRDSGMDLVEMEKVLSCIGKIRRADKEVVLEDDEHAYLVERIKERKWRVADPAIVQFIKDVRDAETPQAA